MITKSWNKIEDRYNALLTVVEQSIVELKILVKKSRQPTQIGQGLQQERLIEVTFRMRIMQILVGARHFDSAEVKQQAKGWNHVNMNIAAFPTPISHDLHQGIINELKEHEHRISQLNIHVEQEHVVIKK